MYRLSAPLGVQIEITEGCHQRCIHCYNLIRPEAYKPRGELTQKQLVTTLEIIAKHGVLDVNLTGGEPMLRKNVVFAMLKRARELGMRVGLNTTAFHVTTQDAQQLYDVGLRTALVSLLGVGQTHNGVANVSTGFERTVQGIKALVAAGIHVQVNMVVSTLNLHEVEAVGSLASDLGAFCFSATPVVPSHEQNLDLLLSADQCKAALRALLRVCQQRNMVADVLFPLPRCLFTAEEEEEFAPILGRRLCLAGITGCVISAHGKIRPCPHNDQGYGNILTEPFTDIWARMSGWSQPEMLPERCQQCVANVVCEGGCRISAKMTTGLYNGEDRYMTAPIDDLDRVLPIRVTTRQQETQLGELRVNSAVRFRKETFGAVIATRDQIEYLNHWGAELFQTLQSWPTFTVERVAEHYQLPSESLMLVINRLVQREMCISNDDPRGGEIYVAPAC